MTIHFNRKTPTAQLVFYTLGAATTAGSMLGSFRGIESELGASLAVIGSIALGVTTYSALNVVFNHTGITKRCAAGVLSLACITVSGETILLDAINKQNQHHQIQRQKQQQQAQKTRTTEQANEVQLLQSLRDQVQALRLANQTDREAATQRQTDLRHQSDEIRRLNRVDESRIAGFQKNVNRQYKPKTNRANIRQARKDINARVAQLDQLNQKMADISTTLHQATHHRDTQIAAITERLTRRPAITQQHPSTAPAIMTAVTAPLGTRVRAYLYDLMTSIFLLLVAWYQPMRKAANPAPAASTMHPEAPHNEVQLDAFPVISTDMSAQCTDSDSRVGEHNALSPQTKGEQAVSKELAPVYDDATLLNMLQNRQIEPNDQGKITASMVIRLSVRMNSPRTAKAFLEDAASAGVLDKVQDGNRGMTFVYPSVITRQTSLKLITA